MQKTDKHILTDSQKVEFLSLLKSKGQKTPQDWRLVHSELCDPNENELDIDSIIDNLSAEGAKFAVDVISNPNQASFLDAGIVKVRYRYVLDPLHSGEQKIQDNTREFCETLIQRDLIFRREDINAMSFRGSNPIAKQRYSIFNSAGGWNCRHAWQREIYVLPQRTKTVENGLKTSTVNVPKVQLSMNNKNTTIKAKFGKWLAEQGRKLTQEEVVDLTSVMLADKAEEQKFIDIQVEDKVLRIDAEVPEKDAAVSWVDAEGNLTDVEDGEIVVNIDEKPVTLVIADRKISEIKEIDEAEAAKEAEQEMSSDDNKDFSKEISDLKESIPAMIATAIEASLSAHSEKQAAVLTTIVEAKLKGMPAFPAEEVSAELSADKAGEEKKEGTMLERMMTSKK